jgi:hypothetical protein
MRSTRRYPPTADHWRPSRHRLAACRWRSPSRRTRRCAASGSRVRRSRRLVPSRGGDDQRRQACHGLQPGQLGGRPHPHSGYSSRPNSHPPPPRQRTARCRGVEPPQWTIADDGRGFDPARPRGLGLAGLANRMASSAGRCMCEARPVQAQAYLAELPVSTVDEEGTSAGVLATDLAAFYRRWYDRLEDAGQRPSADGRHGRGVVSGRQQRYLATHGRGIWKISLSGIHQVHTEAQFEAPSLGLLLAIPVTIVPHRAPEGDKVERPIVRTTLTPSGAVCSALPRTTVTGIS